MTITTHGTAGETILRFGRGQATEAECAALRLAGFARLDGAQTLFTTYGLAIFGELAVGQRVLVDDGLAGRTCES